MAYGIPNKETSEKLAQSLRDLLENPEYLTVTVRENIQYVAGVLNYGGGWVALSIEELIVRNHYDYLGATQAPIARPVDAFQHEVLLLKLGRAAGQRVWARKIVQDAIKTLVEAGILTTGRVSDGQADFLQTRLVDQKLSIEGAVMEVHRKINEKRA